MTITKELKRAMLSATLLFAFGTAAASPITILGENDPANNSAMVDLSVDTAASKLTITVDNTSNFSALITSFAFSLSAGTADELLMVSGTLDDDTWYFSEDGDPGNGNGNGNGTFDLDLESYALTGQNVNGGDPQAGILAGLTGTFMFGGSDFTDLTSFETVWARFQQTGADGKGSDYGYGCVDAPCDPPPPPPPHDVPEPGSLALLGLGLVLTGMARGRRRRK